MMRATPRPMRERPRCLTDGDVSAMAAAEAKRARKNAKRLATRGR